LKAKQNMHPSTLRAGIGGENLSIESWILLTLSSFSAYSAAILAIQSGFSSAPGVFFGAKGVGGADGPCLSQGRLQCFCEDLSPQDR
jgi:hypothetical protein